MKEDECFFDAEYVRYNFFFRIFIDELFYVFDFFFYAVNNVEVGCEDFVEKSVNKESCSFVKEVFSRCYLLFYPAYGFCVFASDSYDAVMVFGNVNKYRRCADFFFFKCRRCKQN